MGTRIIHEAWCISVLCPDVYKKGVNREYKNYRRVSLLYKLLSNILLYKLNPYIKEVVEEYQAVFMLGKSTIDQIHVVK